jgi:hypothetical protein
MTTDANAERDASQPGAVALTEGLGLAPEREAYERAYNAGFVAACRMHGAEIERLRAYANAAHWWAEAHDRELEEHGDNREGARQRMLEAESALLLAGHEFRA